MKAWAGIGLLTLLALGGLRSAAAAGSGGAYDLGLFIAAASALLIFVFIGQRGRAMPDRFLPDTDVDRPGPLVAMLGGFLGLAGLGAALALTTGDHDLRLAGLLFIIGAVVAAARAVGRFYDLRDAGPRP